MRLLSNVKYYECLCSISLAEAHRGSHKQTDFTPKLSDFSHSCKAEDTADSPTISTPSHASPEQFSKACFIASPSPQVSENNISRISPWMSAECHYYIWLDLQSLESICLQEA